MPFLLRQIKEKNISLSPSVSAALSSTMFLRAYKVTTAVAPGTSNHFGLFCSRARKHSETEERSDAHARSQINSDAKRKYDKDKAFPWLMNLTEATIAGGCPRLEASRRIKIRRAGRDRKRGSTLTASLQATRRQLTRKQITELIFESCTDCGKMSSIPQGAFAVWKVRGNDEHTVSMSAMEKKEKTEEKKENMFNSRPPLEGWELTPLKYNSKLMNSIWGLYNRYSVHNFKKNTDDEKGARGGVAAAIWGTIFENQPPAANAAATATAEAPRIMRTGNRL